MHIFNKNTKEIIHIIELITSTDISTENNRRWGKLVKKTKLKSKLGNRINVSNLNAGAYTYNVSVNGKTISGKVIVGN